MATVVDSRSFLAFSLGKHLILWMTKPSGVDTKFPCLILKFPLGHILAIHSALAWVIGISFTSSGDIFV